MKKRWILATAAVLAAAAMIMTACGKKDDQVNEDGDHVQSFTADQAKQLGRTSYHADTQTLWCSLSGSGIDFRFFGTECTVELVGDSAYSAGDTTAARYAVYVNGERTEETQLTEANRTLTVSNPGDAAEGCEVRIVKLSESPQSAIGIGLLTVTTPQEVYQPRDAETLLPEAEKEHRIEFIGDSITCGYGVDGEYGKDTFKTANEDATKAYAIKTAEKLDADYSLVSYSGHGILSGYTTGGSLNTSSLVPPYYDECGHSYASLPDGTKIQDDKWDFSWQPEVVVINLGTNDASYTGTDSAKMKEFAAAYVDFLKDIREKNPDAEIFCTLGIMGQTLCDAIDLAVMNYTQETGDDRVSTMRFDVQDQNADGIAVDWHPSEATHEKAAEKLAGTIKEKMGW